MAKEKEINKGVNFITNPNFFEFVMNVMNMENDIDYEALSAEFEEDLQRTRKVGYGKNERELTYVPSKFLKDRLNEQLQGRWSFIILSEERITDPCQRYNKQDDEYVDSNNYIKVTAMLVIPGLGVQVQFGVKETFGFNESNDWKAATTDAFKKCCAGFGIEASYEIEDDVDDSDDNSSKSSKSSKDKKGNSGSSKGGKKKTNEDLEEALEGIEYDDDELEEALEHEISWGKYRDMTIEEIYEQDEQYLEWIAMNAKEEDDRDNALIVLHAKNSSSSKKKSKKKDDKKSSKGNKKEDKKSSNKKSSKKSKDEEEDDEDDEERQELIDTIQEIFEDDDSYDKVTIKSLIKSVSTNKKHPQGKKSLEDLTVKELEALTNVLLEDEDDEEDED